MTDGPLTSHQVDVIITTGDPDPTIARSLAVGIRTAADLLGLAPIGYWTGQAEYGDMPEFSDSALWLALTWGDAERLRSVALTVARLHHQEAIGWWCVPAGSALVCTDTHETSTL